MPKNTLRNDRDIERVSVCRARKSITIMTVGGAKRATESIYKSLQSRLNYGAIFS